MDCLEGGASDFERHGRKLLLFSERKIHELRDEQGQALVEYALILALITVVCIGALQTLGGTIAAFLNTVASALGG